MLGSSLLLDVITSYRMFSIMLINPVFIGAALVGWTLDDVLARQELGWKFPVIFIEFIALVVTSFFMGYWLMVALTAR